jgi:alkanesulfonate monooxygenase SsuD/methylene tetrahydromethanopterin reductase-like flavin-dependent oxidoreductase (luciferase family)
VQERIPIYLGSMGPKAIEQTARIADGWLPSMFSPERAPELLKPFEGTEADIAPVVMLCVDEDLDRARDLARPWLTVYFGGMGAKGRTSMSRRPSASARARPPVRSSACSWAAIALAPRPR